MAIMFLGCITNGGPEIGKPCVFPYIYNNVSHSTCTIKDSQVQWCYTEVDSNGVGVWGKWGNCSPECPIE